MLPYVPDAHWVHKDAEVRLELLLYDPAMHALTLTPPVQ